MARALAEVTVEEFKGLVDHIIDRPFEVWLTQLMDAFEGLSDENGDDLRLEFAASLRRSLQQAKAKEGMALETFCNALGQ